VIHIVAVVDTAPQGHQCAGNVPSQGRRIAGDQPSAAVPVEFTRRNRCAQSWRRSDLPEVLPHRPLGLRETIRTIGVRKRERGWIHAMGLAIHPLRHPALVMRTIPRLVSNKSADATDGEQRRGDEPLSHESGKRLTSGLCTGFFTKHTRPPLFVNRTGHRHAMRWRTVGWAGISTCSHLWNWDPTVPFEQFPRVTWARERRGRRDRVPHVTGRLLVTCLHPSRCSRRCLPSISFC